MESPGREQGQKGLEWRRRGQELERKGWGPWERYREGEPPDLPGEQRKQRTQRQEELAWPGRVESVGGGAW